MTHWAGLHNANLATVLASTSAGIDEVYIQLDIKICNTMPIPVGQILRLMTLYHAVPGFYPLPPGDWDSISGIPGDGGYESIAATGFAANWAVHASGGTIPPHSTAGVHTIKLHVKCSTDTYVYTIDGTTTNLSGSGYLHAAGIYQLDALFVGSLVDFPTVDTGTPSFISNVTVSTSGFGAGEIVSDNFASGGISPQWSAGVFGSGSGSFFQIYDDTVVDPCSIKCRKGAPEWDLLNPTHKPLRGGVLVYADGHGTSGLTYEIGMINSATPDLFLHSWEGTDWTSLTPAHWPTTLQSVTYGYDPVRNEVVIFGGSSGTYPFDFFINETWIFDGTDWTQRHPAHSPPAAIWGGLAWNATNQALVLNGGSGFSATWLWDGTDWTQMFPPTFPAGPMTARTLVYDPVNNYTLLYGYDQTWIWDGASWGRVGGSSAPGFQSFFPIAYVPHLGSVYGWDTSHQLLWQWDGSAWNPATFTGGTPPSSFGFMAQDPTGAAIYFPAQLNPSGTFPSPVDTWRLDAAFVFCPAQGIFDGQRIFRAEA